MLTNFANLAFNKLFYRNFLTRVNDNPVTKQRDTLLALVSNARNTTFGKEHGFDSIHTYEDYHQRVAPRSYDDFWSKYWSAKFPDISNTTLKEKCRYFALSSGTSQGKTKYLPLSSAMQQANKNAVLELVAWHCLHNPGFSALSGAVLYLGGCTKLQPLGNNKYAGDLSALAAKLRPFFINPWFAPPKSVSDETNWQTRYNLLLEYLSKPRNIQMISGVPMWITKLLEDVRSNHLPGLDKLQLVIHGGTAIDHYLDQLRDLTPRNCQRREVYAASEGYIAHDDSQGHDWFAPRPMRLLCDNGLFYQFIPASQLEETNTRLLWLDEVDTGVDYALVITNNSGLWSCVIGDLVRFVELQPPEIIISGRTSWYISHFGEHLSYGDINNAIAKCWQPLPVEWCFGLALHSADKSTRNGRHRLYVELNNSQKKQISSSIFDKALRDQNADYNYQRDTPFLPYEAEIVRVRTGAFSRLLDSMGKGGGQSKVPRVVHNLERFNDISRFLQKEALIEP